MKILLVFVPILFSCKQYLKNADPKFAYLPDREFGEQFEFLIKKIDKESWKIVYGFSPDCQSKNKQNLESMITNALLLWLSPLKVGNKFNRNSFVYKELKPVVGQKINLTGNIFSVYGFDHTKVMAEKADLKVVFYCTSILSFALRIPRLAEGQKLTSLPLIPDIHIGYSKNQTRFNPFEIAHEIGHAFGLEDTYPLRKNDPRKVDKNRGQPASVMSNIMFFDEDGELALGEDDKNAIRWLYKYYHSREDLKKLKDPCFFKDYYYHTESETCRHKHPLITDLKNARFQEVLMNKAKHNHQAERHKLSATMILEDMAMQRIKDPYGDAGRINAQDNDGYTALHYAVLYSKISRDEHTNNGIPIDNKSLALIWENLKNTMLNIKPCKHTGKQREDEYQECLDKTPKKINCKCIDKQIKNKHGETPLQTTK